MFKKVIKILLIILVIWLASFIKIVFDFKHKNMSVIAKDDHEKYDVRIMYFDAGHSKNNLSYRDYSKYKNLKNSIAGGNDYEKFNNALMKLYPGYIKNKSNFRSYPILEGSFHSSINNKLSSIIGSETNPGKYGKAVYLSENLEASDRMMVKRGWQNYGFNEYVSDLIPLERILPDRRGEWCKNRKYPKELPAASVIICFHNEAWSTLIRTVNSVLATSPKDLLKEIILFDDFSNRASLQQRLEEFVSSKTNVLLIRNSKRQGLIRARIAAMDYITAPIVIFLDSHCECSAGWLEPLLERIYLDDTRVVSPVVDIINDDTFEYIAQSPKSFKLGGFNWDLQFSWIEMPENIQTHHRTDTHSPLKTPTISGGLFAISKKYFKKLGYYDRGFDIWGAENLELSFKTWMCGGSMEIVPCSRVGHVFRDKFPYSRPFGSFLRNCARLAEVWMDDYAKYFYQRTGNRYIDYGNVTTQKELRKKLQCKSFQWYLHNIYPELEIPDQYVALGSITCKYSSHCLDASKSNNWNEMLKLLPCHNQGYNQFWVYTREGRIKRNDLCLDYITNTVGLFLCNDIAKSQVWIYSEKSQHLKNEQQNKCLRYDPVGDDKFVLENCNFELNRQLMWTLDQYNLSKLTPELRKLSTDTFEI